MRVLEILLEPAMAFARLLRLSFDDVERLAAGAYYRELRKRGLSLRAIAKRTDRSLRYVAKLAKNQTSREAGNASNVRLDRWRAILGFMLKRGSSVSLIELQKEFGDVADDLEGLFATGIVRRESEQLQIAGSHFDMAHPDIEHRLDGLRRMLETFGAATYKRFVRTQAEDEAFGRVLSFRISHGRLLELRSTWYEQLRRAVITADAEFEATPSAIDASVCVCFVEHVPDREWSV